MLLIHLHNILTNDIIKILLKCRFDCWPAEGEERLVHGAGRLQIDVRALLRRVR